MLNATARSLGKVGAGQRWGRCPTAAALPERAPPRGEGGLGWGHKGAPKLTHALHARVDRPTPRRSSATRGSAAEAAGARGPRPHY